MLPAHMELGRWYAYGIMSPEPIRHERTTTLTTSIESPHHWQLSNALFTRWVWLFFYMIYMYAWMFHIHVLWLVWLWICLLYSCQNTQWRLITNSSWTLMVFS
jgi:hypothetical protein